jgi:hypothetical protein
MIPRLKATSFERFMSRGRTTPALFSCEDQYGASVGEYVVKLRGGIEAGDAGLIRELLASKLAAYFRIASPEPALIEIEAELADLVAETQPIGAVVRNSIGLNFGTRHLTAIRIWEVNEAIPPPIRRRAADIFSFDALIQNPDRRSGNPNLFRKGKDVHIFDHEMAFSFLLDVLPSPEPWRLDMQRYLENHVFYRGLKSQPIELEGFTAVLAGLSDEVIAEMVADVPAEWNNGTVNGIERHLRALREHASEFADEVRRFLI